MVLKTNKKIDDNELLYMITEGNEDAADILFDRYKYIVDITVNKYVRSAIALSIDKEELYQEAMVGYADAIRSYTQDMTCQLRTFISICVERRLSNYIRNNNTTKVKFLKEAFSFDNNVSEDLTLADIVGDNSKNPEHIKEERESIQELRTIIDKKLSSGEKQILELLINDFSYEDIAKILKVSSKTVYNAMYKIRTKLKGII